jgi:cation diffusion facilitator CzcD-associated flavoprotein CzcO
VRRQILADQHEIVTLSAQYPDEVAKELINGVREYLGDDYDVETHFTPRYRPWQQRIAMIPDGDLFQGIKAGKASMVTDTIERFTEEGIQLTSGETLEADIIVTATGFNLSVLGGIEFSRDGEHIDFADTVTYRGMMFTGMPNMLWVMGYFRASWTLRVDLISDFVCRLLKHMQANNKQSVTLELREQDKDMELLPWGDPEEFNPNYLMRSMHLLPKRGTVAEWQHTQDYWVEREEMPQINLEDDVFVYR